MNIALYLTRMLSISIIKSFALFIKLCLYFVLHICNAFLYYGIISLVFQLVVSLVAVTSTSSPPHVSLHSCLLQTMRHIGVHEMMFTRIGHIKYQWHRYTP